jgi:hypothetical protein
VARLTGLEDVEKSPLTFEEYWNWYKDTFADMKLSTLGEHKW